MRKVGSRATRLGDRVVGGVGQVIVSGAVVVVGAPGRGAGTGVGKAPDGEAAERLPLPP